MAIKSLIIRLLSAVGYGLVLVAFCLMFVFAIINFMLGCETWDERYWTEYNSCLTPSMILEGLTNE